MRKAVMLLGLAFSLAIPVGAEEVVNFKSGRSLPVKSHRIADGMVHVDLGDNDYLAFPEAGIESIVVAGKNVMLKTSYGRDGNRRVPTTAGSYPISGQKRKPVRDIIKVENHRASPIEFVEESGVAIYRPMGKHPAPNKRRLGVTGNMKALAAHPTEQGDGVHTYAGATPMGTRHVVGGITPRRSNSQRRPDLPEPVGFDVRNLHGGPAPEPAEPADGERKSE